MRKINEIKLSQYIVKSEKASNKRFTVIQMIMLIEIAKEYFSAAELAVYKARYGNIKRLRKCFCLLMEGKK